METQTTEPTTITAGDTLAWTKSLADYPASAGNVLHYLIAGGGAKIQIQATADGDAHQVAVDAATSTNYTPGRYRWFSYVLNGAARHSVDQGDLEIAPDPLKMDATTDLRSHAKKVLDAIEATIEGSASRAQEDYEVDVAGNKTKIKFVAPGDLFALRNKYKAEYAQEQRAEALEKGENLGGRIGTRFIG